MPVQSKAQRRLMYAAMKDPKGTGIPRSVAEKFVGPNAHAEGGTVKESKAMVAKEMAFMKKKGAPKSMMKHEMAEAKGKPFAKGGESSPGLEGYNPYAKGGMTKKLAKGGESSPGLEGYNPYAKGGSVRGGGIESKGKTKGKMVKMAMGGKAC